MTLKKGFEMEENKDNEVVTPTTGTQENGGKEQKTFTQEELNTIVEARLAKARKDMPSKEELQAYNEWKQTQKTEQEKNEELMNQLKTNNGTLTNENTKLKAQIQIMNSNVKKEFVKFVTSEVLAMVSDEVDLVTALKSYKKDNPQYFGDTVIKKTQTSPSLNAGGDKPQTTNDIMNNILRGANQE
ncbi:MAG: hypothetical protein ACLS59_06675 [Clostridia bacterium]